MNGKEIRLKTPEDVTDFVNLCSKFECNINVNDGRKILDAKSIIAIFGEQIPQMIKRIISAE